MTNTPADLYGYDPALDANSNAAPIPVHSPPPPGPVMVQTQFLPPVGQQGTSTNLGAPASCTAWAGVYGLATYAAAKASQTPPNSPALQASPAYIYIKVREQGGANGIPCLGTSYTPYFALLAKQGTFNMAQAPYTNVCQTLWTNYGGTYPAPTGAQFKLGAPNRVSVTDVVGMKRLLSQGMPIAYGTHLFTDWNAYQTKDPNDVYVGNFVFWMNGKGKYVSHCMLIIGYSDALGAWRIQNSEGTKWGYKGYVWMDYATFTALIQNVDGFYYP